MNQSSLDNLHHHENHGRSMHSQTPLQGKTLQAEHGPAVQDFLSVVAAGNEGLSGNASTGRAC